MRVGTPSHLLNIVGFLIPNKKSLYCNKVKNVENIRDITDKSQNGFKIATKLLKHIHVKDEDATSSVSWLFDTKHDVIEIDSYEQQNKQSTSDEIITILGKLYDEI